MGKRTNTLMASTRTSEQETFASLRLVREAGCRFCRSVRRFRASWPRVASPTTTDPATRNKRKQEELRNNVRQCKTPRRKLLRAACSQHAKPKACGYRTSVCYARPRLPTKITLKNKFATGNMCYFRPQRKTEKANEPVERLGGLAASRVRAA